MEIKGYLCVGGCGGVSGMTGNAFTVFIGYAAIQESWKDKERYKRKETVEILEEVSLW